jgi:hypothetical protein
MPARSTSGVTATPSQADYYPVGATDLWPWPKHFFDKTADELTERNQKQSPLLLLPIDIRLIIYEYAIASGERIDMNGVKVITKPVSDIGPQARHGPKDILQVGYGPKSMHIVTPNNHIATDTLLGLRYACRQTRAETGPLMFAKLNSFGGRFNFTHYLGPSSGVAIPDALTAEQCNVVEVTWIETCHFGCLQERVVKALADKFPNVRRVSVLENGGQSSRKIDWDAAAHVKKTVREAMGLGRRVELLLEGEKAYPFGNQH